jgi:hypothetical protein
MHWRVGLLRLWMVATAIWFVIVVSLEWLDYPYGFTTFYNLLDWARDTLPGLAGVLFVPPLAVLAVGAALLWAFRGFRAR